MSTLKNWWFAIVGFALIILECALKVFELAEMYEDCALIKQVLEEKLK